MKLEFLLEYTATLKDGVDVGRGPYGTRTIYDVTGGTFEGPRLRGKLLPSGADWILVDDEGIGHLDVRATFETDDGALIFLQYTGILVFNEKLTAAIASGNETQFGDTYFVSQPRFETGDKRYSWLNGIVAVAEGRSLPNAVAYRVYQVVPD